MRPRISTKSNVGPSERFQFQLRFYALATTLTSRATERHDVDEQNDNDGEDDFDDKKNNKKNADDDVNIE